MTTILDKLRTLLTGEPLRAIGYGAIAVVFLVSRALVLAGYWQGAPTLDVIVAAVGAAVLAVTEVSRAFVYSPNTVGRIGFGNTVDPVLPAVTPTTTTTP